MLTLRRICTVLVGTIGGAWLARIIFDWILGFDGTVVLVTSIVGTVLGGFLALGEARSLEPLPPSQQRDALLGWGTVAALVALVACFALPMPWRLVAAACVVGVAFVVLRPLARTLEQRAGLDGDEPAPSD